MNELEKTFEEYFEESFAEFVSDIYVHLRKTDIEYQELRNRKEKILDKYQNLRGIFEENRPIQLSEEEVKVLIQLLDIYEDMKLKQERALFMKSLKESYKLLKQVIEE